MANYKDMPDAYDIRDRYMHRYEEINTKYHKGSIRREVAISDLMILAYLGTYNQAHAVLEHIIDLKRLIKEKCRNTDNQ